jgi:hypothetical protein
MGPRTEERGRIAHVMARRAGSMAQPLQRVIPEKIQRGRDLDRRVPLSGTLNGEPGSADDREQVDHD